LRGAAFGYITWAIFAFFNGEIFGHCKDFFFEMRAMIQKEKIPTNTDEHMTDMAGTSGKYTSHNMGEASELWFSLDKLGFGDIRLPVSGFNISTVVVDTNDLEAMDRPVMRPVTSPKGVFAPKWLP
jgi:hypothetical protein